MKDHEIANLVSSITKAAEEFAEAQQLRQVISNLVAPVLKAERDELEALRAENERLKHLESARIPSNQAKTISNAARFVADVAEAVGMTMGDPIGNIVAKVKLVSAIAEGVERAPQTPEEIRSFVGKHLSGLNYGAANWEPHGFDTYTLTAHDLASSFRDWFDLD